MKWLVGLVGLCLAGSVMAQETNARLQWADRMELATPLSGVVKTVNIKPGQVVKKGDLLIALDQRRFKAELDEAKAVYSQAKSDRQEAGREYTRTMDLYDRNLISKHEKQLAIIENARAKAELGKATSQLAQAKLAMEYSEIQSPFNALVLQVSTVSGEVLVNKLQSQSLGVIVNKDAMLAASMVPMSQLAQLKVGQSMKVQVGSTMYSGIVDGLVYEPQAGASGYPVRVRFECVDCQLLEGQAANIQF